MKENSRLKEYKSALPGIKERVIAAAILLVMSFTMMSTVSFAWLVRSFSPEVTGLSTTVASNGNLEIALASSMKPPNESTAIDGIGSTVEKNLTWGNIINLSDESYGLDKLTLKPAQLNKNALATSPLYGANYDSDGRVVEVVSDFGYAVYDNEIEHKFLINESTMAMRGVRSISSVTTVYSDEIPLKTQKYLVEIKAVETKNLAAISSYLLLAGDDHKSEMNSLATMMGIYMTAKMNSGQNDEKLTNPEIDRGDIEKIKSLFELFTDTFAIEAEAMAMMLNLQVFLKTDTDVLKDDYTAENVLGYKITKDADGNKSVTTVSDRVTESALSAKGLVQTEFKQFQDDYKKILDSIVKLDQIATTSGTIKWLDSGMDTVVSNLVNVGTCTLDGTPVSSIGASNASQYLDGEVHSAVITNGIIYNFERRTGAELRVSGISLSAKVKRLGITVPASITANISTNAALKGTALFIKDYETTKSMNNIPVPMVQTAGDTFGLALDLWVRTNASGSYLTLEGGALTETIMVQATGKDMTGAVVDIYTVDVPTLDENENATIMVVEVYKKGNVWYHAQAHTEYEIPSGSTPNPKLVEEIVPIGYEGENRVWEDSKGLPDDSSTQGSGSCYIFYSTGPEDQKRSKRILDAMSVVFIDEKGSLLAIADMNTKMAYESGGKVTVPLELRAESAISLGKDLSGEEMLAITALEKNVPTFITAIVFLDGTKISNDDVLAASEIQGKLNIQFGSTAELEPIMNEELFGETLTATATADNTSFDFDTVEGDMRTTVTVDLGEYDASSVRAFFTREISSTQGSREGDITFTKTANGTWVGSYVFTSPGKYVLRSIEIDGIDKDVSVPIVVQIDGFAVSEVIWAYDGEEGTATIMTAQGQITEKVKLKFAANDADKLPRTVQGRFLKEDGTAVNVNFIYDPITNFWEGNAAFTTSGEYTLQYLILDGKYSELPESMQKKINLYLGMKVVVYTDSPTTFKYLESEMTDDMKNLHMKVRIKDNTGEELAGLSSAYDIYLNYGLQASSAQTIQAKLTWNPNKNYYEGDFTTHKPGIYVFKSVTVGSNTITMATGSPKFTIISPNPPEYKGQGSLKSDYQYNASGTAGLSVKIAYSSTATVLAKLYNAENNRIYESQAVVYGQDLGDDITEWKIEIPKIDGVQDGNWQLYELNVWNYYETDGVTYVSAEVDDNGKLVEGGERDTPKVFDLRSSNITTKVVSKANVYFTEDKSDSFGGTFMESHAITGLSLVIEDFEGEPIPDSSAKLVFTYKDGMYENGKYTIDGFMNSTDGAEVSVNLSQSGNTTTYTQSSTASLVYAGNYTTTLKYTIGENEKVVPITVDQNGKKSLANAPIFTVSSESPTVKVTGVSPTASKRYYTSATPSNTNQLKSGTVASCSDYNAKVCVYIENKSGVRDQEAATPKLPTVTLTLYGVPSGATNATMRFAHGTNSNYDAVFNFSYNNTNKNYTATSSVGGAVAGTYSLIYISKYPTIYPAGEATIDKITFTYNGLSVTADLSHSVTINNPLTP